MGTGDVVLYLTKRVEFCASHRYHNPQWSDEENRRVFGKCNNLHGHGHNYVLEVTVAGEPSRQTGMVIDLDVLQKLMTEEVLDRFDHKHLNLDSPYFKERIPTSENLVQVIWELLAARVHGCRLHRLRLWEDPTLYVEYFGSAAG